VNATEACPSRSLTTFGWTPARSAIVAWVCRSPCSDSFGSFEAVTWRLDKIYRLVPNASTSEPQLMDSREGNLVGRPAAQWSFNAGTATPTNGTIVVGGDFANGYCIADRLGLSAVPIPALFSGNTAGSFGFPTGQSGLAVWGRTGASVVNANAFRVLNGR
jgi:hypothetical protein